MRKAELLREAIDRDIDQANACPLTVAATPHSDKTQATSARCVDHLMRHVVIGGDHRRAAVHDQIGEQPQLGREIMRDVRMIIHVIARQVGEAAGVDAHAVEPELIEPVR